MAGYQEEALSEGVEVDCAQAHQKQPREQELLVLPLEGAAVLVE